MKQIVAIIGSASERSANRKLVEVLAEMTQTHFQIKIFDELKKLPHFDPERSIEAPPQRILAFRQLIDEADGIIICTPEYVFSIPSGLKNAIEWCVATTVFSDKPLGLITASAHGQKGYEELQLIMKTLMANFTDETALLIQGIKGKIGKKGALTDPTTESKVRHFVESFNSLVMKAGVQSS